MIEEKKYFTPTIEELMTLGYEYEGAIVKYGSKRFDPVVEKWQSEIMDSPCNGRDWGYLIHFNLVRVPYLSKEQFESEGFEEGDKHISIYGTNHPIWIFLKRIYTVMYIPYTQYLEIFSKGEPERYLFRGTCKDINTFRYITKVLNI